MKTNSAKIHMRSTLYVHLQFAFYWLTHQLLSTSRLVKTALTWLMKLVGGKQFSI